MAKKVVRETSKRGIEKVGFPLRKIAKRKIGPRESMSLVQKA